MKKILFGASLLALSFSANTSYAKIVLFSCNNTFTDRNFVATEGTATSFPSASCPSTSGHCTISVTLYDDLTGDIELGEMVIPFENPNPAPSQAQAQQILDEVTTIILGDGSIPGDYQPQIN